MYHAEFCPLVSACFTEEGLEYVDKEINMVGDVARAGTVAQCREICGGRDGAKFFTWHNSEVENGG